MPRKSAYFIKLCNKNAIMLACCLYCTDTVDGFHTYVPVTFFSTAFPIGYPVNCTILWDYSYRMPTAKNPDRSPLPGCYTTYLGGAPYTVYYWIYILDWEYDY